MLLVLNFGENRTMKREPILAPKIDLQVSSVKFLPTQHVRGFKKINHCPLKRKTHVLKHQCERVLEENHYRLCVFTKNTREYIHTQSEK